MPVSRRLGNDGKQAKASQISADITGIEHSYGHAVTEDGESQTAEPAENRVFRKEGSSHMVDEHTDDSHQL